MPFYRNKRKRGKLAQWYADHLKSLSLGDEGAQTAIFKIDGQCIRIDIPMYMWRKANEDSTIMRKMRVVVMDMATHQRKEQS